MKNSYFYIVFLFLITSLYFHYSVYQSQILQRYLLEDFNSGNYREITTSSFLTVNLNFPNLTVTGIPIKFMVSRYYFLASEYEKAFQLIDEGFEANPYFQLGNVLKSEYFEHLNLKDSMSYYSDIAFDKAPKNIRHFMAKMKSTAFNNDFDEMVKSYRKIENQDNYNFHLVFLSTLLAKQNTPDSIKNIANEILDKFPKINSVNVARDMLLFGKENIEKSIKEAEIANIFYQKNQLNEALVHYKNAIELNPGDYVNYENVGLILLQKNKPKEAIKYLTQVLDTLKRANLDGKSEYLIGKAYIDVGENSKACDYFLKSKNTNNPFGIRFYSENCGRKN